MDSPFESMLNENFVQNESEETKSALENSQYKSPSTGFAIPSYNSSISFDSFSFTPPQSVLTSSTSLSPSEALHNSNENGSVKFNKRNSWPKRIMNELGDFYYVISPTYRFIYCSPLSQAVVGYKPDELTGRSIIDFIHIDDVDTFIRKLNQSLSHKPLDFYYRFRKKDDKFTMFEIQGHPYYQPGDLSPMCFFCISRPYPSRASKILDTFLELKVENEMLRKQLGEFEGSSQHKAVISNNCKLEFDSIRHNYDPDSMTTNTTEKPVSLNTGRCSIDLRGGDSRASMENNDDDSSSGQDGSHKLKRKKKTKIDDNQEYMCSECGTLESPEWRKGPLGPKTLCNACGLRWAKRVKQEQLPLKPKLNEP
ncbi:white collar 2 type of transcription factor [Basidiobolus ranarum]|uniref:White collar 2 type of transcription factor n=1 Tax=Basidiobolus ranarum TaxID=34480 RepID=A0ABR2VTX9_9FUNG